MQKPEEVGAHRVRAGWHASLDLEFAARAERTYLARRSHVGPLVVQRPFYPEGGVCHAYIVHPPGGIVGGDRLELGVHARPGSHALLTTPAATKFYRNSAPGAEQIQSFTLDHATLEWLPQETILYPQASARIATRAQLCRHSRFIGWEVVCFGRPASGLAYTEGQVAQSFELWLDGAPLLVDRLRIDGAGAPLRAAYGLAGHPVMATLLAYPANAAALDEVRGHLGAAVTHSYAVVGPARALRSGAGAARQPAPAAPRMAAEVDNRSTQSPGPIHFACSLVDGVFVARAVGGHVDQVRAVMENVWRRLRPQVIGRDAVAPRIWST